ncbi:MAG: hypothetical protein A3I81_05945 [Deltaproteobacteria bacterium RIFCSPLOWO2_02_FULL_55_12]|nr:MAG: hypothetical protein A3I81_05945 [Deltaproteobacteria bacterium RIFCSPLOWO2_02_FULL_55_12]
MNGHMRGKTPYITAHRLFISITGTVALVYLFREPIFFGKALIGPEIWSQGIAVNDFAFGSLKNGVLPLWRSEIDLGYPIMAEPAFSYWLHPINILFLFLPAYTAVNYLLVAHYAMSLFFMYFFALAIGIGRIGSYMAAVVYTFSSVMVSQSDQYCISPAMAWLPLILLLINTAYKRRDARFFAAAGAVYGFQFFQGHVQFWSYTFLMAALFIVYKAASMDGGRSESKWGEAVFAARGLALVLGAGIGIAAIKFLPLLELSGQGGRVESSAGGLDFLTSSYYSMKLSDLPLLVFPDLYGAHLTEGFEGFNSEYSAERYCYIGVAALIFAATAIMSGKNGHKKFFGYAAAFSLIFAMGRDLPFYFFQFHLVPGFGNFQIPLRYLYLFSFSGAVLAGICIGAATDGCQEGQKDKTARLAGHLTLFLMATATAIMLAGWLLAPYAAELNRFMGQISSSYETGLKMFATAPVESLYSRSFYRQIAPRFLLSSQFLVLVLPAAAYFLMRHRKRIAGDRRLILVVHAGAVMTALWILLRSGSFPERLVNERIGRQLIMLASVLVCLYLWKKGVLKSAAFGYLMILIVLLDLIGQNGRYVNTIDSEFYSTYPKTAMFIKKDGSLFRVNYAIGDEYMKRHRIQSYRLDDGAYYKWRETLATSFVYGGINIWKGADGKPSIGIQRQNDFHHAFERGYMEGSPSGSAISALSLLNVKYLVRTGELDSNDLKLVYSRPDGVKVYENKQVMPRAFTVDGSVVLAKEKVLEFMKGGLFDPRSVVILEEPAGTNPEKHGEGQPCAMPVITAYSQSRVTLETACERPGFLVMSDSYYPGWKAYIDGNETKIYRANYVMRSVSVPVGAHKVEFKYEPEVFRAGAVISAVTLVALVLYLSQPFIRRKHRAARAA